MIVVKRPYRMRLCQHVCYPPTDPASPSPEPFSPTCVGISCERVPPHFPEFCKEHQWKPRRNQPYEGECPACRPRPDLDQENTEIVGLDQDEVKKRSEYVDPEGAASNLALKLSDVQTVFGETGGHGEGRTSRRATFVS